MTKSKNTKKALLASCLSMLLCVAMLVGSTFAWFTDSVTTGKNKIVAGNLDVELYARNAAGEYKAVDPNASLFDDEALWEPGHVEFVNLKIANIGTLALSYQFDVTVASEKGSKNVYGEDFKLSDYIKFAVVKNPNDEIYTKGDEGRAKAIADAESAGASFISNLAFTQNGVLYPKDKGTTEEYVTLVVYMPTDVDNKANYRTGEEAPEIELGLTLRAKQVTFENDSFGPNYDADAKYEGVANEADLREAVKAGGYIKLMNNIVLTEQLYLENAPEMVIDGNGFTVTVAPGFKGNTTHGRYDLMKIYNTNNQVTLHNITLQHISLPELPLVNGSKPTYHTLDVNTASNVVLKGVTLKRDFESVNGGAAMVLNASNVTAAGKFTVVTSGSAWGGVNVDGKDGATNLDITAAEINFSGEAFAWVENQGVIAYDGTELAKVEQDGKIVALVAPAASVNGQGYLTVSDAIAAATNGSTVTLAGGTVAENITVNNTITLCAAEGKNVTLTGTVVVNASNVKMQGINVVYTGTSTEQGDFRITGENFTMEQCTFKKSGADSHAYNYAIYYGCSTGTLTLNDVTFVSALNGTATEINNWSPSLIGCSDRWNHDNTNKLIMNGGAVRTNGFGLFDSWQNAEFNNVAFSGLTKKDVEGLDLDEDVPLTMYMAYNSGHMKNVQFKGCSFNDIRSWGMLIAGDTMSVKDCNFVDCLSRQISVAYGKIKSCEITGNVFDLSKGYGVKFEDAVTSDSNVTVSGNTFKNADITIWNDDSYCLSNDGAMITATGNTFENCNSNKIIAGSPFDKITIANE